MVELYIGDTFRFKVYCNANTTCYSKGWKLNVRESSFVEPKSFMRIFVALCCFCILTNLRFHISRIVTWFISWQLCFKVCARIREVAFAKQVRKTSGHRSDFACKERNSLAQNFAILHSPLYEAWHWKKTLSIVKLWRKLGTRLHFLL